MYVTERSALKFRVEKPEFANYSFYIPLFLVRPPKRLRTPVITTLGISRTLIWGRPKWTFLAHGQTMTVIRPRFQYVARDPVTAQRDGSSGDHPVYFGFFFFHKHLLPPLPFTPPTFHVENGLKSNASRSRRGRSVAVDVELLQSLGRRSIRRRTVHDWKHAFPDGSFSTTPLPPAPCVRPGALARETIGRPEHGETGRNFKCPPQREVFGDRSFGGGSTAAKSRLWYMSRTMDRDDFGAVRTVRRWGLCESYSARTTARDDDRAECGGRRRRPRDFIDRALGGVGIVMCPYCVFQTDLETRLPRTRRPSNTSEGVENTETVPQNPFRRSVSKQSLPVRTSQLLSVRLFFCFSTHGQPSTFPIVTGVVHGPASAKFSKTLDSAFIIRPYIL